jgi:hypothetical protein
MALWPTAIVSIVHLVNFLMIEPDTCLIPSRETPSCQAPPLSQDAGGIRTPNPLLAKYIRVCELVLAHDNLQMLTRRLMRSTHQVSLSLR